MRLAELVRDDLIDVRLEATNKWEAIESLIDLLISAHELRLVDREKVVDAVFKREKSLSTGLEHGLAVPHASVSCVDDIVAAVGISKEGIPFESLDGKPAQLIIVLIIPEGGFQAHVRTLAGIARLANNPEFRERIIASESPDDVLETIYDMEVDEEEAAG